MRTERRRSAYGMLALLAWSVFNLGNPRLNVHSSAKENNVGEPIILSSSRPLFTETQSQTSRIRRDREGNIYVLNQRDSSVLMYSSKFKFLGRIGSFGQGPEDLLRPSDFTINSKGELIIADTGNDRIQVMSTTGAALRAFRFNQPSSIDVLSTGEILVVGAFDKQLIQVLSPEGEFVRAIGSLASTPAENVYPGFHYRLNRGSLWVDRQDNIYWAANYLPRPTVRKYSRDGRLLLEFNPVERGIEKRIIDVQNQIQESLNQGINRVATILHGVVTDPKNGDIWVFPAAPQVQIYNAQGQLQRVFALMAGEYPAAAWSALVMDDGRFIAVNKVLGCHLFRAPASQYQPRKKRRI